RTRTGAPRDPPSRLRTRSGLSRFLGLSTPQKLAPASGHRGGRPGPGRRNPALCDLGPTEWLPVMTTFLPVAGDSTDPGTASAYGERLRLLTSADRRCTSWMRLDWASDAVHSALGARGGSAVGAICALALAARDERELRLLGTGPLESFLTESPDRTDIEL